VLLGASHPGPVGAVTATALGLAASGGAPPAAVARIGAAVLSGQLAIGWQNDYLDAARDLRAGRPDKPLATGAVSRRAVGRAAGAAAALCVPLSLASGRRTGALHLLAVASGAAYNTALKATPLSFAPYALSFGLLPRFCLAAAGEEAPLWASAAGSALGLAAHFVNVLPDRDEDRKLGVLGLPQRLGPETDIALAGAFLGCSALLVAHGAGSAPQARAARAAGLALAGGVVALARRGRGRAAFRLVLLLALLDVAALLRATARRARGGPLSGVR